MTTSRQSASAADAASGRARAARAPRRPSRGDPAESGGFACLEHRLRRSRDQPMRGARPAPSPANARQAPARSPGARGTAVKAPAAMAFTGFETLAQMRATSSMDWRHRQVEAIRGRRLKAWRRPDTFLHVVDAVITPSARATSTKSRGHAQRRGGRGAGCARPPRRTGRTAPSGGMTSSMGEAREPRVADSRTVSATISGHRRSRSRSLPTPAAASPQRAPGHAPAPRRGSRGPCPAGPA